MLLLLFVLSWPTLGALWLGCPRAPKAGPSRVHAAEWLERFQRLRGLRRQGAPASLLLQPDTRRYYAGETVHSGEADAASAQSDGGVLGRGGNGQTERCRVKFGPG